MACLAPRVFLPLAGLEDFVSCMRDELHRKAPASELQVLPEPMFALSAVFVTLAGAGEERANTSVVSPAPSGEDSTRSPAP